jgi:UDP-glucose 4-epimerase
MYFDNMSGASTPDSVPTTPDYDVDTPSTERSVLFPDISEATQDECTDFILVIGGLGYIGSHTVWELLKAGRNVAIVDNCCNSYVEVFEKLKYLHLNHLPSQVKRPTLAFHQVNYRDDNRLRNILALYHGVGSNATWVGSRISGVIHFAAYKAVAESFEKPLDYYENNVSGVVQVCRTLAEFGIKNLVFSSSATVYGELADKGGRLSSSNATTVGQSV